MLEVAERTALAFLTFWIGERLYAIAAEEVAEVIRMPALARVPQAPASLLGLGNLRGRIVPMASARVLLGGEAAPEDLSGRALVLAGDAPVGVAIGAAPTLVSTDRVQTEDAAITASADEKLLGVFSIGDEVARVLDVRVLIAAAFAPRAPVETRRAHGAARAVDAGHNAVEQDQKIIAFMVAGQEFALELDVVREIILAPEIIAPVPHSESLVLGVAAYRDALLPLLSLRGLLGLGREGAPERSKVVVSSVGGALVGLVADQTRAIVSVPEGEADPPPAVLSARAGAESQIKAIYRADEGRRLISILAPTNLFRGEIMDRLASTQRTRSGVAGEDAQDERAREQFLVFRLGEDEFALPIAAVIEVARVPQQITKVPRTPAFLEGVISFRGDVLPVVDQRRRFDMPVRDGDESRRLVIVRSERHRAGLIVDSVSEVLSNPKDAMDPAPDLTGDQTRLVLGVINLESAGRMVMVVDPVELLSRAERGLLDAFDPSLADSK